MHFSLLFFKNAHNFFSGIAIGPRIRIHNPDMISNKSGNVILFQSKRSRCPFLSLRATLFMIYMKNTFGQS